MAADATTREKKQITAAEIANYVVCGRAWDLKRSNTSTRVAKRGDEDSHRLRGEWLADQDFSARLRRYAKTAYCLLVLLVIVIFLLDQSRELRRRKTTRTQDKIEAQP